MPVTSDLDLIVTMIARTALFGARAPRCWTLCTFQLAKSVFNIVVVGRGSIKAFVIRSSRRLADMTLLPHEECNVLPKAFWIIKTSVSKNLSAHLAALSVHKVAQARLSFMAGITYLLLYI